MSGAALRAGLLRLAALLVPRRERAEWLEEWRGELAALDEARGRGTRGLPGPWRFVVGAIPHAVWTRAEGWTMGSLWTDLRYAARTLRRAPGFTVMAVLTLALGIGANGAVFSVVNTLLFRPPPAVQEPERLVQIARSYEDAPRWDNWSWPAYRLMREEARSFSGIAGVSASSVVLGTGVDAVQLSADLVSGSYFQVLGTQPYLGRLLGPRDDLRPGEHPVVVLGHGLWTRRFGADPGIVGRTVTLGAVPYEVVGVAQPGFVGAATVGTPPDLWLPTMQYPGYYGELPFERWGWSWIDIIGRLEEGATLAEAEADARLFTDRLRAANPEGGTILALVGPGARLDPQERTTARTLSVLLLAVVGAVLLLACSNVANLFLARTEARRTELGVRVALGAGRARVGRQLLTESLLLAALATLVAVPLVGLVSRPLVAVLPPLALSTDPDPRVWLFTGAMGIVAGVLFGVVPSWSLGSGDLMTSLREGGGRVRPGRTRFRDALVVLQVGISMALVAAATLLGRSMMNARDAHPGFDPEGVAVAFADLAATGRYDDEEDGRAFLRRVAELAQARPEIQAAAVANQAPVVGGHSRATVRPADQPDHEGFEAEYIAVGADYFETLRIPVREGRALGGPEEEADRVVVVNEALARLFWPQGRAVGRRLAGEPGWRVVGVVGDVQMRSLRDAPRPAVYYPAAHLYQAGMALHARGTVPPARLQRILREVVARADPELPVSSTVALRSALTRSLRETRTLGWLTGTFGALALLLAAAGLYGLVSFGVSQQIRELGVRKALGAEPGALVRMVMARGAGLALAGVGLGLAAAWAVGRALSGLLFGVEPLDAPSLVLSAGVLLVTALLAAWVPARRASRVDALISLRE